MNKKTAENIVAVTFLVFFLAIAGLSLTYGSRARLVPFPIALISAALITLQLVIQNKRDVNIDLRVDAGELFSAKKIKADCKEEEAAAESAQKDKLKGKNELGAIILVIGFLALIMILGIEIATVCFVTAYFRFVNSASWLRSLLWGLGTVAGIYLLFTAFLDIDLYKGVFMD